MKTVSVPLTHQELALVCFALGFYSAEALKSTPVSAFDPLASMLELAHDLVVRLEAAMKAGDPELWRSMDTAPADGEPFIGWLISEIDDDNTRMQPVVARWREPEGWIWSGPPGVLTGWVQRPPRHMWCAHQSEEVIDEVLRCSRCGVALEDFAGSA